jgi:hypothetical protein
VLPIAKQRLHDVENYSINRQHLVGVLSLTTAASAIFFFTCRLPSVASQRTDRHQQVFHVSCCVSPFSPFPRFSPGEFQSSNDLFRDNLGGQLLDQLPHRPITIHGSSDFLKCVQDRRVVPAAELAADFGVAGAGQLA